MHEKFSVPTGGILITVEEAREPRWGGEFLEDKVPV